MIYFDYTSTTKPKQELLDLHQKINNEYWFNTEAMYKEGSKSFALMEKSAKVACDSLNLTNKKVLFTSGATEANNTAIYGTVSMYYKEPKHIITTYLEHASVLNTFIDLEKRGFKVTYLKPNKDGIINISDLEQALTSETVLVSIMWVNNIIGTIQPIKEIIEVIKKHKRAKLHIDAVQGLGKLTPDFNLNDVDLITVSGHKLNGIKGTGILFYNDKMHLSFLQGGHQQFGVRPGTVDLAGCVVMAKTIQLATRNVEKKYIDVLEKYNYLVSQLTTTKNIVLNTSKYSSPYILSISFKQIKGETVLHMLESSDIMVSTGSACNSGSKEQEKTLIYTLEDSTLAVNTIRISLSTETTFDELNTLITKIKEIGK
jgi:cysteine desulfurase